MGISKTSFNKVTVFFAGLLISICSFALLIDYNPENFEFHTYVKFYTTILIILIYYGVFLRGSESIIFGGWKYIFILPFILSSLLFFFQDNSYFIYITWIMWILTIIIFQNIIIVYKESKLISSFPILGPIILAFVPSGILRFIIILLSAIWITGFLFLSLGTLNIYGYKFSNNIILSFPFFGIILDIRKILLIITIAIVIVKPAWFKWQWDLQSLEKTAIEAVNDDDLDNISLPTAIRQSFIKAKHYFDEIISKLAENIRTYWSNLKLLLNEIGETTKITLLISLSLVSFFILSKIASIQSTHIYDIAKTLTYNDAIKIFPLTILGVFILYFMLIINWIIFHEKVNFGAESKIEFLRAIKYIVKKYTYILWAKIPFIIFIASFIGYGFSMWFNYKISQPGIFIILFSTIGTIYIIIFLKKKDKKYENDSIRPVLNKENLSDINYYSQYQNYLVADTNKDNLSVKESNLENIIVSEGSKINSNLKADDKSTYDKDVLDKSFNVNIELQNNFFDDSTKNEKEYVTSSSLFKDEISNNENRNLHKEYDTEIEDTEIEDDEIEDDEIEDDEIEDDEIEDDEIEYGDIEDDSSNDKIKIYVSFNPKDKDTYFEILQWDSILFKYCDFINMYKFDNGNKILNLDGGPNEIEWEDRYGTLYGSEILIVIVGQNKEYQYNYVKREIEWFLSKKLPIIVVYKVKDFYEKVDDLCSILKDELSLHFNFDKVIIEKAIREWYKVHYNCIDHNYNHSFIVNGSANDDIFFEST